MLLSVSQLLPSMHACRCCLLLDRMPVSHRALPLLLLLPLLLQEKVHDEFVEMLTQRVSALRLGSGMEPGTTQGPLISAAAVDRVGGSRGAHCRRGPLLF